MNLSKITLILLLGINICFMWFIYTSVYPFKPVTLNQEITTEKRVYTQGEDICMNLDFTKNMEIKPEIEFYLVNGFITQLEGVSYARPLGDQKVLSCKTIPEMHPGIYRIDINISYEVFPWRTISYIWSSEEFEIIQN